MITAKLKDNIINCYDNKYTKETFKKWAEKNILLCPICNKSYEYCHGKVVTPYFRHKDKQKCDYLYNEPETEEHIRGKIALYEWIKIQEGVTDTILEGWIPETKQRPDIMFKYNNKQYVIEYQCTPISSEYLERHGLYQAGGIEDIWILGTEKYIEKHNNCKSFRKKEIEKHTNYYYDSTYNIFLFSGSENFEIIDKKYKVKNIYFYNCEDNIDLLNNNILLHDTFLNKYITCVSNIVFNEGNIVLKDKVINIVKERTEILIREESEVKKKREQCDLFLKNIFQTFKDKYKVELQSMSYKYGFKYDGHYYKLDNIEKYPNINFNKITYIDNKPKFNKIFEVNAEIDGIDKIISYLDVDLINVINRNIQLNNLIKNFKEKENHKLNQIKKELALLNKKPLYILFLEDNNIINKNIKFKMINNYSDNIVETGNIILQNLKLLESKNVNKYVLMIPRKRIKQSSSFWYPTYKVRNYKSNVISDLKQLGLNFLEYNDLKDGI